MPDAQPPRLDALMPPEIAAKAEQVGVAKCGLPAVQLFVLGVLAGAFIGLGAMFATTTAAGIGELPYGVGRMLVGLAFCLGLILVVVGGAELFTGNNLIVMAWARRDVTTRQVLRNWSWVYAGNAAGALGTALLVAFARQYEAGDGEVGRVALAVAAGKLRFGLVQAVALGVLCNALVCLAVWLALGARTVVGRVSAIVFPITAFVAAGFEHSVANMYFVPYALIVEALDPAFVTASGVDVSGLGWSAFVVRNLLPVTVGNVIGGAVLVAAVYTFVYLRDGDDAA